MTGAAGPESLPSFPYHADPLSTGSVTRSETECICCRRRRGYIYVGPAYSVEELDQELCPWCIADGSASERYEAVFTEVDEKVPVEVRDAVETRTPGFIGWQQERWLVHCGDAALFLGLAGAHELAPHPDALEFLRLECVRWTWPPEEVENFLSQLTVDGQPTAYLFRCRVCQTHLAYADFT